MNLVSREDIGIFQSMILFFRNFLSVNNVDTLVRQLQLMSKKVVFFMSCGLNIDF